MAQLVSQPLPSTGWRELTPASVFSLIMIVLLAPSTMPVKRRPDVPGDLGALAMPCGNVDSRNITPSFWVTPMVADASAGAPVGAQVQRWPGVVAARRSVDLRADPAVGTACQSENPPLTT